jgi:hypothetical protein
MKIRKSILKVDLVTGSMFFLNRCINLDEFLIYYSSVARVMEGIK